MEIVGDKAVLIRTRDPGKYSIIPKSKVVEQLPNGGYTVKVHWGLDEMRVLKNLGVKNVVSPITKRYNWPGRYKPMAHQIETASFLTLHRRAFCFNEPGTGKTLSALWAADYLMDIGEVQRVLVLCPLSIMHSAWMNDLTHSVMHRSAVVCHHPQAKRRVEMLQQGYEIVICNYEGLDLISHEIRRSGDFDLIIVDECFVRGTPVLTPSGLRPIEKLAVGESVLTSAGRQRIKRLVRNTSTALVKVCTSDGNEITCTREHPFFTDVGWVTAANLAGRRLVSAAEVSYLRTGVSGAEKQGVVAPQASFQFRNELFKILRSEEVSPAESGSELLQPNANGTARQTNGTENSGAQGEAVLSDEGAHADNTWGERHWNDASRTTTARSAATALGMELPRSIGETARRLSYELQTRLCKSAVEDRAGSGWPHAPNSIGTSTRQEKDGETSGTWVVSVSPVECRDPVDVFNIEVEGAPNYFVGGGVLVHNCNAYKNPQTQRWKALASVLTPNTYLWMMTGTPAAQSPLDAYGLAKLVNPGNVPRFYTAWRDKVMNKISMFKWAPKADAREQVYNALQPAVRFTKAQCLDLPPVVTETREVPLTPQQQKYYKIIKEQLFVQTAGQTISAVNAGVALNKLLQVSCGAAYSDDKEVVVFDATPRLNVLLEAIEETERKVIVFALFRSSIDTIVAHLNKHNIRTEQIHGDVPASKRGKIVDDFQHKDDVRVLVMQPQATAHGLTLTAADTVVFYGPLMSVEMYMQCIARADRKGQDADKVTVIHIQSSPLEVKLFKAMNGKVTDHALLVDMFNSESQT